MSADVSINTPDDVIIAKNKDTGVEYYVIIEQDEEGCDWIQDECPVGHLITWHRDYKIGEKHDYREPYDLWKSILLDMFYTDPVSSEKGRQKSREYSKLLLEYTRCQIKPYSEVDEYYKNSTYCVEDAPYFICHCNNEGAIWASYPLSTDKIEDMTDDDLGWMWEVALDDKLDASELLSMIEDSDLVSVYPIYMYDHSGIALSVSNSQYPFNDRWDAGQVGWWYITKEEAIKEGWTDDKWQLSFLDCIKDYIEEFNEIAGGNCWGFISALKEDLDSYKESVDSYSSGLWRRRLRSAIMDNRDDSCYGYVGDYEALVKDYCSDQDLEIIGVLD